jgi:exoribonuclease-2
MIFANSLWANLHNQHNNRAKFLKKPIYYGIFRGQHMGKVKMSTFANPHDAMGVEQYMWATSPLRRYVDLVNQWQLIALLKNQEEALTKEEVMVIIAQFESQYLAYKNIQNRMEDYWSLAYLLQNNAENTIIEAMVLKSGVVQLNNLNLRTTVLNMPAQNPNTLNEWQRGDEILVTLKHIDLMNARCELSYHSMSEKV